MVRWYFVGLALSFFGTSAMYLAALARTTAWLPVVLAAGFVHGVGLAWAVIAVATLVQQRTPPAVLGRVSATAMSIVFAAAPVGLAVGAALVANLGFAMIYVIIAVITSGMAIRARGGRTRRFTARRTPHGGRPTRWSDQPQVVAGGAWQSRAA